MFDFDTLTYQQTMKRVAIFLALLFFVIKLSGQVNKYGIPLIKNYSSEIIHGSDYTHSIIKDNLGNLYLANEDMGIIRYDGNNWRTIPVRNNGLIRAMDKDDQGTIYAGGRYEFGYLEPDIYGKMRYVSLSQRFDEPSEVIESNSDSTNNQAGNEKIDIGEIKSLVVNDSHVYFASARALFEYDIKNDTLKYINLGNYNLKNVLKVFLIGQKIILGDNTGGLFEYKDGEVKTLPGGDFFNRKRCMVIIQYDENQAVVATYEQGLFLYNYVTGEIKKDFFQTSLQEQFTGSLIYSGIALTSGEFAIGTIAGGVFVLDRNGKLVKKWDRHNSDLMDNTILAFYSDPSGNSELWISTIRFIAKVYVNLPFTELSLKSGIEGNVDFICEMEGKIYVSTDLGVYKSGTNEEGILQYTKIPEILSQVFPIYNAKVQGEEFLLAGSINGLFMIRNNGKVIKIIVDNIHTPDIESESNINVRIIVQSKINSQRFYIGLNTGGVKVIDYKSGKWSAVGNFKIGQGSVVGIEELDDGDVIFGSDYGNNLFRVANNSFIPVLYGAEKGVPEATISSLSRINDQIVVATSRGLFQYLPGNDSWIQMTDTVGNFSAEKEADIYMQDEEGDFWLSFKDERYSEMLFQKSGGTYSGPLALLPNVRIMDMKDIDNRIWVAKSNSVFVIEKEKLISKPLPVSPLLSKIIVGGDSVIMDESFVSKSEWGKSVPSSARNGVKIPELRYTLNTISFFWSTPYFINEEATLYSYKLDGFDRDWSNWEKVFYKDYTNLPFGHYYFRVKSKTVTEIESDELVYQFYILKPWYLKAVMIIAYAIAVVFIILAIIRAYTKKLKNENIRLEGIVAERTAVVVKQKEELESSIHYARRIQMALLPSEAILSENIKNYFVLFKPRDIVSGDFYWMTKKGERLYIVAADCTGHGVPGAFMSLLGMSFLDEIIDKNLAPRADVILQELRLHVTESLKQVGGDDEAKDGMDIAILVIDFNVQRIEFSGAYNPCFRVRKLTSAEIKNYKEDSDELPDGSMSNGKYLLETIYASKMPIGISSRMHEAFVFNDWNLEKGVSYYLFSDGYIDQFGGPNGRKFMKKNFKQLILEIQDYPMSKQKELLDQNLTDWMGHSPQIDDILVMGIRTE